MQVLDLFSIHELSVAKNCGEFKKTVTAYKKVGLLILDEWLIRPLTNEEVYNLLEIVEARCIDGSMIFCTQYETEGWYDRINADADCTGMISEAIMDRVIHNAYQIFIDGKISMRERNSTLKAE